jgi:hypothetical protein
MFMAVVGTSENNEILQGLDNPGYASRQGSGALCLEDAQSSECSNKIVDICAADRLRSLSVGSLQTPGPVPQRPFSRFAHLSPAIRRTWHASPVDSDLAAAHANKVPVATKPNEHHIGFDKAVLFTKSDELLVESTEEELASQDDASITETNCIPMDEIL